MKRALMLCAVLVLVTGCAVGPDYRRPELGTPDSYRAPVAAGQTGSIANIEWFELFNDPYLERLIRSALEQNTDLGIALARLEASNARLRVARSAFGPELRGTLSPGFTPGEGNDAVYSSGIGMSWELDVLGKIRRASEAERAALLATEDGTRAVMSSLVVQVAQTWYSLLALDQEARVIERTLDSQQRSLELVRAQLQSGVSTQAEEQQATAQLAATRAQLPRVRQRTLATENALSILLGQAPQSFMGRPAIEPLAQIDDRALRLGLPVELLERRPDIRGAEQQLHAATARVGVAIANRFPVPTIGLTGIVGRLSTDFSDIGGGGDSVSLGGWGPYVDIPIVDWGRAKGNEQAARAGVEQALLGYRATVLNALREVSDAVNAFVNAGAVIDSNAVYANAAGRSLQLQRQRFGSGVVGYLEVLDAERQLLNAELGLARARLDRVIAYLDLYRALGGGWSDADLSAARLLRAPDRG
ncbi:RND transporter [Marinobacterium nitratireducens]|uniref:RND transporter n=1 Tax=Marinobacterium nitratireducens TaxID=518897 RepID=A0A917Z9J1_9GAMM|nr:efflux transporter outer membrane subunit [Marinobacterium nitratireducens]GGO76643.1 RND transporter [Marinobacterium nitratireducens]